MVPPPLFETHHSSFSYSTTPNMSVLWEGLHMPYPFPTSHLLFHPTPYTTREPYIHKSIVSDIFQQQGTFTVQLYFTERVQVSIVLSSYVCVVINNLPSMNQKFRTTMNPMPQAAVNNCHTRCLGMLLYMSQPGGYMHHQAHRENHWVMGKF